MKTPTKAELRKWLKDNNTKWFLDKLAWHLNVIDTVRNVENGDELMARKIAVSIIERTVADLWVSGGLQELQQKISKEEESLLERVKNLKEEY